MQGEVASEVDALECVAAIQQRVPAQAELPEEQRIVFRIGIDMDDIAVEDGDIDGMSARHRGADA